MKCEACGYEAKDEIDFLAHLIECESEPEESWLTYANVMETQAIPFKNSEILEEGK